MDLGRASRFERDVVVVGGCGQVGLPLAIALADRGARVGIYDTSLASVAAVNAGVLPFREPDAALPLQRAAGAGYLTASAEPAIVGSAEHVIVVTAEPADERPCLGPLSVVAALASCVGQFRDGQILILRSTVSPGATAQVEKLAAELGIDMDVAFCPELIAEGQAMTELFELPQIVSSRTARGLERASALFRMLTPVLVPMSPEEAELAKLFTNAWRYVRLATANQLFMIANDRGLDFERIRHRLMQDYPAAADLPAAGFSVGPSLLKDTVALAEASACFALGDAAISVNEGLPGYLVSRLELRFELRSLTVGILGMAFNGSSGDTQASLSYQLKRILSEKAGRVMCTDPLVCDDPELLPLDQVMDEADLLVVAAPHPQYRGLVTAKPVADLWNVLGRGVLV